MAAIDWQATLALLEADPDIGTPAGEAVLKRLLTTGQQYEAARRPDVFYESTEHLQWSGLRPGERLNRTEPPFYIGAYYAHPLAPRRSGYKPQRIVTMPDGATKEMKEAYAFWIQKDQAIANRFAIYEIVRLVREANDRKPQGPTAGGVQQGLISAVAAAEAWLAS